MRYALALERKLSKDEILNRYLNIAYFGAGAYGIAAASQRYFAKSPAELTLAEAALLAGLVQSPDAYNPINGDADSGAGPPVVRAGPDGRDPARSPADAGRGGAGRAARPAARASTPNGCTAVPDRARRLGLLLRLLHASGGAASRRSAPPPTSGSAAAPRRLLASSPRWTRRCSRPPPSRRCGLRLRQPAGGADRGGAAGHRPGAGHGGEPALQPGGQPGRAEQLPEHGQPADRRRRQRSTGTRRGSTFKLFTMLAALESGLPLATEFDAPSRLRHQYPVDGGPASCDGYWCPANANPSWMDGYRTMWTGFGRSVNTYFVWLTEQVGADKVVEMAAAARHHLPRADADAAARPGRREELGPVHPGRRRHHPAGPGQRVRHGGRRGHLLRARCRWSRSPTPTGRQVAAGQPDCQQVLDTDVARAATDAARCPVGDQSAYGQLRRRHRRPSCAPGSRPPGGRQDRQLGAERHRDLRGVHPAAGGGRHRREPGRPPRRGRQAVSGRQVEAVGGLLAWALRDQPVRDFVPPSQPVAFEFTSPRTGN